MLGQHRRDDAGPGVGRLAAEDDQVVADPPEHVGHGGGGTQDVGPGQGVIDQVHSLVGAHRQRLADGLGGARRTHREDRDAALVRFGDPQAFLDRVLVEFVRHGVGRVPVESGVRSLERALRPGVRHLLHTDDDVHVRRPTSLVTAIHAYSKKQACQTAHATRIAGPRRVLVSYVTHK